MTCAKTGFSVESFQKAANMVARYRGGGSAITGAESSIDSLDDDDEDEDDSSSTHQSQSSYGTRESVAAAGGTETLPCGGVVGIDNNANGTNQRTVSTTVNDNQQQPKTFQWTLSNWGAAQAARRRNNSVRVDLASPEDISLDTDTSSRVVFTAYGTTV